MSELLRARLAPFRHRHFRNFFLAQTLSLVGTWSHDLARSWIIVSATGSSGALGNINLAIAVPCLFLILQGGVLVDRTDVRKLIIRTKSLLGISALILTAITEYGNIQVWHLLIFGLIEGIIISFDSPAFQALTVRMVPRQDFQQAIALNSTNFHASRTLGPFLAAWLMAWHGPSLVFLFDACTYFLVAIVLSRVEITVPPTAIMGLANKSRSLREGLVYIARHHLLRYRILQLLLTISCVFPMMAAVFRAYVQTRFNLNAQEFGHVFSFPALGSMCGALSFAVLKPKEPIRALFFGVPLVFTLLVLMPWMPDLTTTVAAMSFTGFGVYLAFASLTVSMHLEVEEQYRGRLGSVIGLGFSAIGPLMCFPWGHFADFAGAPTAIWSSAAIFGAGSLALALSNKSP
jgi:MFS family permease